MLPYGTGDMHYFALLQNSDCKNSVRKENGGTFTVRTRTLVLVTYAFMSYNI